MQRRLYNLGVFDKVDMAIQNPAGQHGKQVRALSHGRRPSLLRGHWLRRRDRANRRQPDQPRQSRRRYRVRAARHFEFSRLNLWGLGHSLNFKSRYSTLDRRISLNYLAPRYHNVEGRNISFTALYDNTRDVLTFTARRLEGSMQMSQRYSKATTFFCRYSWRDVQHRPAIR